jgi:hypothetical protein
MPGSLFFPITLFPIYTMALIYLTYALATLSFRAENEGARATEGVVEKSRRCVLCHADTKRSLQAAGLHLAVALSVRNRVWVETPWISLVIGPSGISPLASVAFASSWPAEMKDIGSRGELNILMPVFFTASVSPC